MKKLNFNFLDCAKDMPRLTHSTDGSFDINTSEVVDWLISQPEIRQKIFDMAKNQRVIFFCNGKWQGINYHD